MRNWMIFQVLVGIWLMVSPFVLGCREVMSMTANDIIFGAVVAILGLVFIFMGFPQWRHRER